MTERTPPLLVTFTASVGRNGVIESDLETHDNSYAEVAQGLAALKAEIERVFAEAKDCPHYPMNAEDANRKIVRAAPEAQREPTTQQLAEEWVRQSRAPLVEEFAPIRPTLYLTARQIQAAQQWALPPGHDPDDLDSTWRIGFREAGTDEDGEPYEAGPVMWMDDYPEEGCLPLDVAEPLSSEAPVPQTEPLPGIWPYEATANMREAYANVVAVGSELDGAMVWRAMLAASPSDWHSHSVTAQDAPAVPQSEPLTDRGRLLKLTADEVAEYGALCVANSRRKITAREALEEYFEYHPEAAARQVAQTATPQGDQFEYVGYVDDGDVLKYGDAPANNSCHVYRKLGPVIDLANPGRPRMAILKDMLHRGEITAEQYRREERGEASESKVVERYRSRARAIRSVGKERSMKVTDEMVSRFLNWRLPDDFAPDAGITFKRVYNETSPMGPSTHEPVGTNLLNAPQARAMLEHVLGSSDGREPKEQT